MALALTKWFVSVFKVYVGVFTQINKYSMIMVIYPSRTQDYYGCFVIYVTKHLHTDFVQCTILETLCRICQNIEISLSRNIH